MADELTRLTPAPRSRRRRTRVGRGDAAGRGTTCGRGQKGQRARSGHGIRIGFEGGQMPLARRLPKRGFTNVFAKDYTVIDIGALEGRYEAGTVLDARRLLSDGVISRIGKHGLKVLGGGELRTALTVRAARFTRSAIEKIEAAGGKPEAV